MVISKTELDSGKFVVSDLEVVETNITNLFSNSTVSSILPTSKIIEVSSDSRILPEWISLVIGNVIGIISDSLARELPWNHIMEDTETISTA
jgi:hypothetical protein